MSAFTREDDGMNGDDGYDEEYDEQDYGLSGEDEYDDFGMAKMRGQPQRQEDLSSSSEEDEEDDARPPRPHPTKRMTEQEMMRREQMERERYANARLPRNKKGEWKAKGTAKAPGMTTTAAAAPPREDEDVGPEDIGGQGTEEDRHAQAETQTRALRKELHLAREASKNREDQNNRRALALASNIHCSTFAISFQGRPREANDMARRIITEDFAKAVFNSRREAVLPGDNRNTNVNLKNVYICSVSVESCKNDSGIDLGVAWEGMPWLNNIVDTNAINFEGGEAFRKAFHVLHANSTSYTPKMAFDGMEYLKTKTFSSLEHLNREIFEDRDLIMEDDKVGIRNDSTLAESLYSHALKSKIAGTEISEKNGYKYYPKEKFQALLVQMLQAVFRQKKAQSLIDNEIVIFPLDGRGWAGRKEGYCATDHGSRSCWDDPIDVSLVLKVHWISPTHEKYTRKMEQKRRDQSAVKREFLQAIRDSEKAQREGSDI